TRATPRWTFAWLRRVPTSRMPEATHVEGDRSVGFQLGCNFDVPDAGLEGPARASAAQRNRCPGRGCPGALERIPAAACARPRVAVDPDAAHARGVPQSRGLRASRGDRNPAFPQSWLRRVRDQRLLGDGSGYGGCA